MSTPRKIRRYQWKAPRTAIPAGSYDAALLNPEYATYYAAILSGFEHLESYMPRVLTVLLGLPDERPAGYVYRALRNPSARIDVLRDLLEKSPSNKNKSQQYDELISKYQTVRSGRNAYAHGLWWTDSETNAVYLARRDEHGFAFFDAQPEPLDNLKALHMQIGDLIRFLHQTIAEDLRQLQQPQGNPRQ